MLIKDLFAKPISRSINGVIKADQADDASVWQELDEYVITKELDVHFRRFFESYLNSITRQNDPDIIGKVGVWVSGFFGSGKSHFIKILSYLLGNRTISYQDSTKQAFEFFKDKISDTMLLADIKRAISTPADVILFNIDSKADAKDGRDSILKVFLRVFNERLGFCGEHPHIAHMERYLEENGKFNAFKNSFQLDTGKNWVEERDAYNFHTDSVAKALSAALGKSIQDADTWIERFEKDFSLTVENFSKWVKEYLDSKGGNHRIIFLVDEVGQFIGQDTHLMLNLQTITENLGTICGGRAWIVVTSQEDIDAVLGEVKASKANDFSKIQGRFKTRLSLSSANVDEVIQRRLLEKTPSAKNELVAVYCGKADILKNQLRFVNAGMTFRAFGNEEDFAAIYPFAPYQFQLVQKVFENIRKAGATGLHLARGERSMLDAFQTASINVLREAIGVLVPLHMFYPSIESFLEGAVKSTIDNAARNASLEPFDGLLLKTLFLIRYVNEIKGTVDNLITLFIDQIDADRLAIRNQVEAGLQRLEGQTLIGRNGEEFFFLTNEERDISREIKLVELTSAEEAKFLGELIFDDLLGGLKKHRYPDNSKDFEINRLCDLHPHGNRTDGALTILMVTPLSDDYRMYKDGKCLLESDDKVIVRLDDDTTLGRELRLYLQTEKYITRKNDHSASSTTRQILQERANENRQRRDRLKFVIDRLVKEGRYFAAGQKLTLKKPTAISAIEEAFNYLIKNTFSKMSFLCQLSKNPLAEIKSILSSVQFDNPMDSDADINEAAIKEVGNFISLSSQANRQIILDEMIEKPFGRRPYGWPELEVLLLVVKLVKNGEIALNMDGAVLPVDKTYDAVQTPAKWKRISISKRKTTDTPTLQKAARLAKELFGKLAPISEDALDKSIKEGFTSWQSKLGEWSGLAKTGNYPGQTEISDAQGVVSKLLSISDSFDRITKFLELENDLKDISDDIHDLEQFHKTQKPAWERLLKAQSHYKPNARQLEQDADAGPALQRILQILQSPSPYGLIKEGDALIQKVEMVNTRLVGEKRSHALERIEQLVAQLKSELQQNQANADLSNACLLPLQGIKNQVEKEVSIAHISQLQTEAQAAVDEAFDRIVKALKGPAPHPSPKPAGGGITTPPPKPIRARRVVQVSSLSSKGFLESKEDVEAFLQRLRKELESALANNERIEIR
ncbi:BREX system P-loop protein BrxC [Candidatus Magnetaquicoccus inordinatus]|uniref:BREX system P-loop protein BrxC n=1 Tax=Candidatus Magnetaquicoccus inordinatus TaxID=2496818 RepID=UPI00102C9A96|nr:BREX system P-loop protein BrxC [Candidatus Magnetaquicoccus inordinatus]